MFAIGAANYVGANGNSPPPDWPAALDPKTSEDYITLAKQLIPAVYDEADVDSIRAMATMVCTPGIVETVFDMADHFSEHRYGEPLLQGQRLSVYGR